MSRRRTFDDAARRLWLDLHEAGEPLTRAEAAARLGWSPGYLRRAAATAVRRGWVREVGPPAGRHRDARADLHVDLVPVVGVSAMGAA